MNYENDRRRDGEWGGGVWGGRGGVGGSGRRQWSQSIRQSRNDITNSCASLSRRITPEDEQTVFDKLKNNKYNV